MDLSIQRRLLVSGLSITVLLCGGVFLVVLLTSETAPVTDPPPEVIAVPQAVPALTPAVAPGGPLAPPWAATAARATSAAQQSKPQAKDPSAPGKADRATRKAVRKAVLSGVLEEELAACVDRDREVWFGGGWGSTDPVPRAKPAILTFQLETVGRQVKIADVRVKTWGGTSRAAVDCARSALMGTVVPAPGPGSAAPMQMNFLLSPRSRALAAAR